MLNSTGRVFYLICTIVRVPSADHLEFWFFKRSSVYLSRRLEFFEVHSLNALNRL